MRSEICSAMVSAVCVTSFSSALRDITNFAAAAYGFIFMTAAQDVRAGGRQSSSTYQFTLWDPNLEELQTLVPRVVARVQQLPELADVNTDREQGGLHVDSDTSRGPHDGRLELVLSAQQKGLV